MCTMPSLSEFLLFIYIQYIIYALAPSSNDNGSIPPTLVDPVFDLPDSNEIHRQEEDELDLQSLQK